MTAEQNIPWTFLGLVLDLIGAAIMAWGVFVSPEKERARGFDTSHEVWSKIRQSGHAKVGFGLLIAGFLLQIIGNWPR